MFTLQSRLRLTPNYLTFSIDWRHFGLIGLMCFLKILKYLVKNRLKVLLCLNCFNIHAPLIYLEYFIH